MGLMIGDFVLNGTELVGRLALLELFLSLNLYFFDLHHHAQLLHHVLARQLVVSLFQFFLDEHALVVVLLAPQHLLNLVEKPLLLAGDEVVEPMVGQVH